MLRELTGTSLNNKITRNMISFLIYSMPSQDYLAYTPLESSTTLLYGGSNVNKYSEIRPNNIAGGIESKRLFTGGVDMDNFLNRLGNVLTQTQTACFSRVLIPNHFQRAIGYTPQLLVKSLTVTYKLM